MADDQPIIDSELLQIEELLRGASVAPSTAGRDRVMYACGVAAGRQQLKRKFQIAAGVAASFAVATLSLGAVLLTRMEPAVVATNQETPSPEVVIDEQPLPKVRIAVDPVPQLKDDGLRVRDRIDFESLANRTTAPTNTTIDKPLELMESGPRLRAGSKEWFVESL